MTSAHTAAARHLRVVDENAPDTERPPGEATPVVGYVVLVPEGTDPTELFTADGTRARFRPLLPAEQPASEQPAGGQPAVPAQQPSAAPAPAPPAHDGLHVDPEQHTAHADGQPLELTYLEFELLAHFVQHPHRVHTRTHLVATLWGYSHVGDGRTVDVHIARLRRKLGRFRDTIVTVRRVGYKFEPSRAR
ncbi:winged helix-turn-helix domain-containing protein [Streptomyces winkii]|uniref:winged helix-turn-helix domain-containing protein n=1 Tax=Streptomyces winkii TaxID=3051178 RepID=UPI0028D1BFAE|nr:winged helix-turn-helix domain-containing protein [Streptomyces sp. DSM 40971]